MRSARALPTGTASLDDVACCRPHPRWHRPKCRRRRPDGPEGQLYAFEAILETRGQKRRGGTIERQSLVKWKDPEVEELQESYGTAGNLLTSRFMELLKRASTGENAPTCSRVAPACVTTLRGRACAARQLSAVPSSKCPVVYERRWDGYYAPCPVRAVRAVLGCERAGRNIPSSYSKA